MKISSDNRGAGEGENSIPWRQRMKEFFFLKVHAGPILESTFSRNIFFRLAENGGNIGLFGAFRGGTGGINSASSKIGPWMEGRKNVPCTQD